MHMRKSFLFWRAAVKCGVSTLDNLSIFRRLTSTFCLLLHCVTLCEPFPSLSGQLPGIREVIRELHFDVNVWYPAVGRPHVKGQEAVSAGLAAC